jgi:hypothetical protein
MQTTKGPIMGKIAKPDGLTPHGAAAKLMTSCTTCTNAPDYPARVNSVDGWISRLLGFTTS